MSPSSKATSKLSAQRQALFAALLREEGMETLPEQTIPRLAEDENLPLSFAQQRLWFFDQLIPHSPLYNLPAALQLAGPLDIVVLAQSLHEIVRRHASLRTTFVASEGQPTQAIAPAAFSLPVVDLEWLPPPARPGEARRLAFAELTRPFDLAQGPLLRAILLRLSAEEHILLLTMHHIVSDGWSMGILFRELTALYKAFARGEASPLAALPIRYADFAAWQREWLQGETLAKQLTYWKQQLAGAPPVLNLPFDRPRPAVQTFRGAHQSFALSGTLSEKIKKLCRREEVTLFMALLAAFQTLLYRYTGQDNIVTGTTIANRTHPEVEDLIGFFANTLVLRSDLSANPPFRELLARVREVCLGAYAHQDMPFEKLVETLQPERSLSNQPLFQVIFQMQAAPAEALQLPGITARPMGIETKVAKFDLAVFMWETAAGLKGNIEYNSDLFDDATIGRMVTHFQKLLHSIVADPDQSLCGLSFLAAEEQKQLIDTWNDTQASYSQDLCIHQLFERQVLRTPHAVAVLSNQERLTYEELNRQANQMAHHLRSIGVGPGTFIAVYTERTPAMVAALLAILKAGGAYVPLEKSYPKARLQWILNALDVSHLITQHAIFEIGNTPAEFPMLAHIIDLDTAASSPPPPAAVEVWPPSHFQSLPADNPAPQATANDLAYIIFTSGSTGTPKGVVVQHRSVINLIEWVNHTFNVGPQDRLLFVTSLCFDLSVYDIFGTLAAGGSLRIVSDEELHAPERLLQLLYEEPITFWNSAPATFQQLVPFLQTAVTTGTQSRLRQIFLSGDWIPVGLPDIIWNTFPDVEMINLGGATEASIWSNFYAIKEVLPHWTSIPYGKPIQNARYYVLDSFLRPCPIGVAGDLYIGGDCLAVGYANRPALTAAKFIPDPFGPPGSRLYNTGDRARFWADGNIEFLGRVDFQVKIRGFRIELGEIETVLGQHPAVREAVVLAREDIPGEKRLVAYVVAAAGEAPGTGDLRRFLQSQLPDYMVPAVFVMLETLPLTANGKVNRRALPSPAPERPRLESDYAPPRTAAEETLATIWKEVLRCGQVGIYDNFFELGGDSILSIQVVAKAAQAGMRISTLHMFQHPTVAALAQVAMPLPATAAAQGPVTGEVPLTPVQHWFFEQNFAGAHHFNQAVLLQAAEPLHAALLETAVGQLLLHHDVLRHRFRAGKTGWEQVALAPSGSVPFSQIDLSALPPPQQEPAMRRALARLQTSLNFRQGPLLRAALLQRGPAATERLFLAIHHLAVDVISWRILIEDLQTVYQQLAAGETVRLPAKTTSFKEWARRLKAHAYAETVQQEQHGWLAALHQDFPRLPVDYPEGNNSVASARIVTVALTVAETDMLLQETTASYRMQVHEIILAALALAFARHYGIAPLLVDVEGHGREDIFEEIDLSRTVGWFTMMVPLPLKVENTADPTHVLRSIKEQIRRIPHRGIGYGLLRYLHDDPQVAAKMRTIPQAELIFNYLGRFDEGLSGPATFFHSAPESTGPTQSASAHRHHLLEITASVTHGCLQIHWRYSENCHHSTTIEKLAQAHIEALQTLVTHQKSPDVQGYTPSDFSLANLDQKSLDKIIAKVSKAKK